MPDSPNVSTRTVLLILILLVVCYVGDWSDDYYSYWASTRYSAFEVANGRKTQVSGGRMDSSPMMAMFAQRSKRGEKNSALESVFGSPLGSSSDADMDTQSRSASSNAMSGFLSADNDVGNSLSGRRSTFGPRSNAMGAGNLGFGGSGSSGFSAWSQ